MFGKVQKIRAAVALILLPALQAAAQYPKEKLNPYDYFTSALIMNVYDIQNMEKENYFDPNHKAYPAIRILRHPNHPEYISFWKCLVKREYLSRSSRDNEKKPCAPISYNPLDRDYPLYFKQNGTSPAWFHVRELAMLDEKVTTLDQQNHTNQIVGAIMASIVGGFAAGFMIAEAFTLAGEPLIVASSGGVLFWGMSSHQLTLLGLGFLNDVFLSDKLFDAAFFVESKMKNASNGLSEKLPMYIPLSDPEASVDYFLNNLNRALGKGNYTFAPRLNVHVQQNDFGGLKILSTLSEFSEINEVPADRSRPTSANSTTKAHQESLMKELRETHDKLIELKSSTLEEDVVKAIQAANSKIKKVIIDKSKLIHREQVLSLLNRFESNLIHMDGEFTRKLVDGNREPIFDESLKKFLIFSNDAKLALYTHRPNYNLVYEIIDKGCTHCHTPANPKTPWLRWSNWPIYPKP